MLIGKSRALPGRVTLADLLVDAGRDDLEHRNGLTHVLERLLAQAFEHEVLADALRRRRAHDDLTALRRAGEAPRLIRRRPARGEGPSRAELGRADVRLAGVDAHVELDRRKYAAVLLVELRRALADREG